ncbi:MAG: CoA pyrophosphatase [Myxococcota bacterium]
MKRSCWCQRPADAKRHAGQFALPGGRLDAGETGAEAARRELAEELGLTVRHDAVLGRLDDFVSRSGFRIRPVVLWSGGGPIVPEVGEVARVFKVAFDELRSLAPTEQPSGDPARPLLSVLLKMGRVYAPTAAMIHQFCEVALHGRSTRVHHYEQPPFAWR